MRYLKTLRKLMQSLIKILKKTIETINLLVALINFENYKLKHKTEEDKITMTACPKTLSTSRVSEVANLAL
jgi:hypothetical protein